MLDLKDIFLAILHVHKRLGTLPNDKLSLLNIAAKVENSLKSLNLPNKSHE